MGFDRLVAMNRAFLIEVFFPLSERNRANTCRTRGEFVTR